MSKRKQAGQLLSENSSWYLRFWQSRNDHGTLKRTRVRVRLGEATTKKVPDAIRSEADRIMAKVNASDLAPEQVMRLVTFAETVYLPYVAEHLRPSTADGYKKIWHNYLKVVCASAWLNNTRTHHVQNWLEQIANQHQVSTKTLQHIKFVLSGLFRLALQQGYREDQNQNPVTNTKAPKQGEERETHAATFDELRQMLAVLSGPARVAVAIAGYSGLRSGEIAALRWEDVQNGELYVRRSIWRGHTNPPKTRKSEAPVPIIPQLQQVLDLHHLASALHRLARFYARRLPRRAR